MNYKNINYWIFTILLAIISFLGGTYIQSQKTNNLNVDISDSETWNIGMELKFPPFETIDPSTNTPKGVSVEIANELGKRLNKKIVIKPTEYPSLIPSLETKNIDLIISSMTITPERQKTIDFSSEYAKGQLSLAYNKNFNYEKYTSLNSNDVTIAVKKGTVGEQWAKQYIPNAKIKGFEGVGEAMLDVNNNSSQAFIYDPLSLIQAKNGLDNVQVDKSALPNVSGWGIGMRKNNPIAQKRISQELDKMKNDGFYDRIRNEFLKEEQEKYAQNGLEFYF